MPLLPVGINERLMKLRTPPSRIIYLTIISAYAPTLRIPDDPKEQFYEQFDQVIRSTPTSDKLVIFGDFNARVGRDYSSWEVGKINCQRPAPPQQVCRAQPLNHQRLVQDGRQVQDHLDAPEVETLIDFIIVRQRDIRDVRMTRAMRGAECWTDAAHWSALY